MACGRKPAPRLHYEKGRYLRFLPGDLTWFLTARGSRRTIRDSFNSSMERRPTNFCTRPMPAR